MITQQNLLDAREQMQEDLLSLLDTRDNRILSHACQIIVDRMKPLIEAVEEEEHE